MSEPLARMIALNEVPPGSDADDLSGRGQNIGGNRHAGVGPRRSAPSLYHLGLQACTIESWEG
jgi:hypothetical protein